MEDRRASVEQDTLLARRGVVSLVTAHIFVLCRSWTRELVRIRDSPSSHRRLIVEHSIPSAPSTVDGPGFVASWFVVVDCGNDCVVSDADSEWSVTGQSLISRKTEMTCLELCRGWRCTGVTDVGGGDLQRDLWNVLF